jgi:membrane associated rhomboid family serine protease
VDAVEIPARSGYTCAVLKRFVPIVAVIALCWLVFGVNNVLCAGRFNGYGIWPRHVSGLPGIIFSPFLHGSLAHLAANTLPLLILGAILCARAANEFILVCVGGILLGGVLTWLFARNAIHIGASGLVFCFFGYLASQAYFKRTIGSLILSVVCLIGYGGMLRGLFPHSGGISWESHVAGLVAGIVIAWLGSNEAKKRRGVLVAGG